MRAIGASSFGCTGSGRSGGERLNVSIHSTSRASSSTWRMFTAMPLASTARITPLKNGFAWKFCSSCAASSAASRPTAIRKPPIQSRACEGLVMSMVHANARLDAFVL